MNLLFFIIYIIPTVGLLIYFYRTGLIYEVVLLPFACVPFYNLYTIFTLIKVHYECKEINRGKK